MSYQRVLEMVPNENEAAAHSNLCLALRQVHSASLTETFPKTINTSIAQSPRLARFVSTHLLHITVPTTVAPIVLALTHCRIASSLQPSLASARRNHGLALLALSAHPDLLHDDDIQAFQDSVQPHDTTISDVDHRAVILLRAADAEFEIALSLSPQTNEMVVERTAALGKMVALLMDYGQDDQNSLGVRRQIIASRKAMTQLLERYVE